MHNQEVPVPDREPPRLLTSMEAAAYLKIQPQTLRRWRCSGSGPIYVRLGSSQRSKVVYRLADLDTWLSERSYSHTSDETVRA